MSSQKKQSPYAHLLTDYVTNGGVITICKPKLAPNRRPSNRKVLTRDQIKSFIGQHPLTSRAA